MQQGGHGLWGRDRPLCRRRRDGDLGLSRTRGRRRSCHSRRPGDCGRSSEDFGAGYPCLSRGCLLGAGCGRRNGRRWSVVDGRSGRDAEYCRASAGPGRPQHGTHLGIDETSCIGCFRLPGPRLQGAQGRHRTSSRVLRALGQKCRQPLRGRAHRLAYSVHWTLERTKPVARQVAESQRRGWPGHLSLGDSRRREVKAHPRIEIANRARAARPAPPPGFALS